MKQHHQRHIVMFILLISLACAQEGSSIFSVDYALESEPDPSAEKIAALIEALKDISPDVRSHAAWALARMGEKESQNK